MKKLRKPRRTSDQMYPLIERYNSSGQLQKNFCKDHDIPLNTFQYWLKKYREEHSARESHSFQKIAVLPEARDFRHEISHMFITTPSGMEIKIPLD